MLGESGERTPGLSHGRDPCLGATAGGRSVEPSRLKTMSDSKIHQGIMSITCTMGIWNMRKAITSMSMSSKRSRRIPTIAPRSAGRHATTHVHGPGCGHEAVPHGDHIDYLVDGRLHHPHGDHCDNHAWSN
jgi:hypothetical protein